MKAIIIGAGIAGPVAALALKRAGIESQIFERRSGADAGGGLFLTLAVNGMRVLDRLGLLDVVQNIDHVPTPRLAFYSSTGKRLGEVPNGYLKPDVPSVTVARQTLHAAFADRAVQEGIPVHYGKRLDQVRQTHSKVTASFEDGTEVEGDILVGADGLNSRVRQQIGIEVSPSDTGLLNFGGKVSHSALDPTQGEMRMIWGRRAFFGYTVRPNGEAWWFANVGSALLESAKGTCATRPWNTRLHELFDDDPPMVRQMIARTSAELRAYPILDMPSIPYWHRGLVVLVGDAAHAVSPSSGQGASLAMEDAITLAKCLRDINGTGEALARYESLRRGRAERIVAEGRRRGNHKTLTNPLAVALRDLALSLVFRFVVSDRSFAWILDHDIAWNTQLSPRAGGDRT